MTTYCANPRCRQIIQNLSSAYPVTNVLCSECFPINLPGSKKPLPTTPVVVPDDPLELVDSRLLPFFPNINHSKRSLISCFAATLSLKKADKNGEFLNPGEIIKEALRSISPSNFHLANPLTSIRNILIIKKIWIPVGPQAKGRNSASNRMRLSDEVLRITTQL